jgi:lipopolysaccharide/colanic/teichoic acid biosynthesis glycosyltransferase
VKRAFDLAVSATGLVVLSPLLAGVALAVWLYDRHSPFYVPLRAARGGGAFRMVKFRSMTVGADRTGVDSTSAADSRITPVGRLIRAGKLDELMQLWNVLLGHMSLVGPRPQVLREVDLYTEEERVLLQVRPGITDLASIVFSDEGDILKDVPDPDLGYHQLIRPWKSRLGLLYVRHSSVWLDVQCVALTIVALVSRPRALKGVQRVLNRLGADEAVKRAASRQWPLTPFPPPGMTAVVSHR